MYLFIDKHKQGKFQLIMNVMKTTKNSFEFQFHSPISNASLTASLSFLTTVNIINGKPLTIESDMYCTLLRLLPSTLSGCMYIWWNFNIFYLFFTFPISLLHTAFHTHVVHWREFQSTMWIKTFSRLFNQKTQFVAYFSDMKTLEARPRVLSLFVSHLFKLNSCFSFLFAQNFQSPTFRE